MEVIRENLAVILPLLLLQVGLAVFCARKILNEGVENLSKPLWLLIVIVLNFFGPVMFLIAGRKRDSYDPGI